MELHWQMVLLIGFEILRYLFLFAFLKWFHIKQKLVKYFRGWFSSWLFPQLFFGGSMSLRTFRTWRSASLPPETAKAYPPTPWNFQFVPSLDPHFPFGATSGQIFQRCLLLNLEVTSIFLFFFGCLRNLAHSNISCFFWAFLEKTVSSQERIDFRPPPPQTKVQDASVKWKFRLRFLVAQKSLISILIVKRWGSIL